MIKRIQERLSSSNSKQAQILATQKWTSLRSVVLGAEPADPTVIQNMHDVLGIPREAIKNAYGMAETGAFVSCGFARIMDGVVACGPMEGYSKLILVKQQPSGDETNDDTDDANDENQGRPIRELVTTEGDIGEIWVKSPLSASGYWGQEQLSKETFRNKLPLNVDPTDADWLATGDLGRSQNGELFVTGRKKELIIINGKNYFPVDLERAVEQSFVELVRPGCTVAYQHSATQVGVVLELRKGIKARQAPTPAAIKQAVSRETGVGLQHILILDHHTVPKTTSGKLRRKETRERCTGVDESKNGWPADRIILWWHHKQRMPAATKAAKSMDDSIDMDDSMSTEESFSDNSDPLGCDVEGGDKGAPKAKMGGGGKAGITRKHKRIRGILQDHVGGPVKYDNLVSDLGLTSVEMTSLKSTLEQELSIKDDAIQVAWFFDGEMTVKELMENIIGAADGSNGGSTDQCVRQPYVAPLPVAIVSFFLQMVAALIPPLYLGAASLPGFFLFKLVFIRTNIIFALALSPLYMFGVMVQSGVLLVALKWLLVGKQKAETQGGYHAVWSFPFAGRWIVRQCCRLSWKYTPWGALGDTELLNMLHRLLGTKVGRGVSIAVGQIDDFDLVTIGDGSSVSGHINTDDIALGVQVFSPVVIGANCSVEADSFVGRGSILEDNITIRTKAMVPANSRLAANTKWHGIPVVPWDGETNGTGGGASAPFHDVESQEIENNRPILGKAAPRNSSLPYTLTKMFTVLILSPYLFSIEFTVTFTVWTIVRAELGWLALAPLVWAAPTAAWLIMLLLAVILKRCLLGTVRPRRWREYGFFHCARYIVDHVVMEHMYRWHTYAQLFGCPFADSMVVRRFVYWLLGAKIGQKVMFCDTPSGLTAYDLLTVHDGTMWGGGASVDVFRTTDDGYLVGEEVIVGKNAYLGGLCKLSPGTVIHDGGAVATATVASGTIHSDELFMGTSKQHRRDTRTSTVSHREVMHFETGCALGSVMLATGSAVTIFILFHISKYLSNKIWYSALPDSSAFEQSCVWSAMISVVVGLGLPLLSTAVIVVSKILLVGTFTVGSTPRSDPKNIPLVAFTWTILRFSRDLGREVTSGTWMELWYNRALGANIGNHVYLDGAYLFEHDLIHIGDYTTIRAAGMSCHQVSMDNVELAPIHVGQRCALNFGSCLHGRDSMEDDTTLELFAQPVIGTKMNGGRWTGYPAKKTSSTSMVPPRPQDPIWFVCLFLYPCTTIGLLLWTIFVAIDHAVLGFGRRASQEWFRRQDQEGADGVFVDNDVPEVFQGVFATTASDSDSDAGTDRVPLYLRLANNDKGNWEAGLRLLRWNAGTYIEAQGVRQQGIFWWDWVSYDWQFDASKGCAFGKLRLGLMPIPSAIVEGRLEKVSSNGGWAFTHKWFRGDGGFSCRIFAPEI